MSSLKLDRTKTETEEKRSIVSWFMTYCNHEFGLKTWLEFMKNERINYLIEEVQEIYGDAIFKELADFVTEQRDIEIKDLLADFSNFIHSYY